LSGAAQRARRAAKSAPTPKPALKPAPAPPVKPAAPKPSPPAPARPAPHNTHALLDAIPAPPIGDLVGVECWATGCAVAVAMASQAGADRDRLRVVRKGLQGIGKLRDKARRSAKACELLKLRCKEVNDPTKPDPPANPMGAAEWAYYRLEHLTHRALTVPNPAPLADQIEDLATIGFVPSKGAIDDLTARLRKGA